jgi:hypothetical protein
VQVATIQGVLNMETQNARQLKIVASGKPKKKLGRHTTAMVKAITGRNDIDTVKREMLLGLARAWDRIEESGKGGHTIPSISKELREIWDSCALPDEDDLFE